MKLTEIRKIAEGLKVSEKTKELITKSKDKARKEDLKKKRY